MRVLLLAFCLLGLMTATGCSRLSFYPDPEMTNEVGLKAYYPKPYVLVARDGTAKVTSVSVVYLPDLEHPVYAKAHSGYGSANLTLALSNGVITSFGQQTDTKIPETVTSLAGLDTALATAVKTRAEAANLRKQSGSFGKNAEPLKQVASDLRKLVNDDVGNVLTSTQRTLLRLNADAIDGGGDPVKAGGLAGAFAAPDADANQEALSKALGGILKAINGVKSASDILDENAKKIWGRLASLQQGLAKIQEDVAPKETPPSALSLYEVLMSGGVTSLREVPLGSMAK